MEKTMLWTMPCMATAPRKIPRPLHNAAGGIETGGIETAVLLRLNSALESTGWSQHLQRHPCCRWAPRAQGGRVPCPFAYPQPPMASRHFLPAWGE